jgi:bifunctional N-acetylglucosamine-1-phosphate-uridyltransferase/glucosamine-1-phosphate-acetyltransferase GlmU-like protein
MKSPIRFVRKAIIDALTNSVTDENGNVLKIVEEADASDEEKKIHMVNSGVYCVDREYLITTLGLIDSDNAQGELYLTDIVGVIDSDDRRAGTVLCPDSDELIGVNSLEDLKNAEQIMQKKQGKKS